MHLCSWIAILQKRHHFCNFQQCKRKLLPLRNYLRCSCLHWAVFNDLQFRHVMIKMLDTSVALTFYRCFAIIIYSLSMKAEYTVRKSCKDNLLTRSCPSYVNTRQRDIRRFHSFREDLHMIHWFWYQTFIKCRIIVASCTHASTHTMYKLTHNRHHHHP